MGGSAAAGDALKPACDALLGVGGGGFGVDLVGVAGLGDDIVW